MAQPSTALIGLARDYVATSRKPWIKSLNLRDGRTIWLDQMSDADVLEVAALFARQIAPER